MLVELWRAYIFKLKRLLPCLSLKWRQAKEYGYKTGNKKCTI